MITRAGQAPFRSGSAAISAVKSLSSRGGRERLAPGLCSRAKSCRSYSVNSGRHDCFCIRHPPGRISRQKKVTVRASGGAGGGLQGVRGRRKLEKVDTPTKKLILGIAVFYMALVIFVPTLNVFVQAFRSGPGPFLSNILEEDFLHAVKLTLMLAACAVPVNTVFGITMAIIIARNEFRGKTWVMTLLDLPFSISPVITGLMLVLLYGREGWFAPVLQATGFRIVFAFPGKITVHCGGATLQIIPIE